MSYKRAIVTKVKFGSDGFYFLDELFENREYRAFEVGGDWFGIAWVLEKTINADGTVDFLISE